MAFVPAASVLLRGNFCGAPVSRRRPSTSVQPTKATSQRRCMTPQPVAILGGSGDSAPQSDRESVLGKGASGGGNWRGGKARRVFVVGKVKIKHEVQEKVVTETEVGSGLFGVQAKAYWESMGVLPLSFAAFGVTALVLKLVKVKKGQWKAGDGGVNRAVTHESIVTNEEEEAELHVYKCSGCGYEMYPARGREFKFFPANFKCPLCQSPKSAFWDLNDPDDPRNQEEEEDEEDDSGGSEGVDGGDGDGGDGGDSSETEKSVVGQRTTVKGEADSE